LRATAAGLLLAAGGFGLAAVALAWVLVGLLLLG